MELNDIIIPENVQNIPPAVASPEIADDDTPKRRRRTRAEIQADKEAEARALIAETDGGQQKGETPAKESEDVSASANVNLRDIPLAEAIFRISLELRAPKTNRQADGDGRTFPYRTVEDILSALKPLREKYGVGIDWDHDVVLRGEWVYNQVTLRVWNLHGEERFYKALAREEEQREAGSWAAQVTGSCISYATKYALQSAFSIDNTDLKTVQDTDAIPYHRAASKDDEHPSSAILVTDKPKVVKGTTLYYQIRQAYAQWKGTREELESDVKSKYDITDETLALVCNVRLRNC